MFLKSFFKSINISEVYDTLPDAIIVINFQKNIVAWNKRAKEIFGFSKRDVIGKNIGVIFLDEIERIYQNLSDNKSSILTARTKSNEEIYVEITCRDSDVKDEVIISARDVTKNQKVIEKLLLEYDKAAKISQNKSSFIASFSHEVRTPMHSIIGFSQALLDNIAGEMNEKQTKYVTIISRNANNLLGLLNSILDISKIEAGRMEFNFKLFDIFPLLNSVAESIQPLASDKKLDFSMDLSDIVKKNVFSDENMLRQVLLNILSNAVKFTDGGAISLKVSHPDLEYVKLQGLEVRPDQTDKSFLLISISDTGCGISEEDLNTIFDEYRQLEKSTKKAGGTGLGLAISKKILHELYGNIWVESEVGQGSTFSFIIPIDRPKAPEEAY